MTERFEITVITVGPEYQPHIAGTYVKINKVIGTVKGVNAYGEQIIAKKTKRELTPDMVGDDAPKFDSGEFDLTDYLSDNHVDAEITNTTFQRSGISASTFQSLVKAAGDKVYKINAY